MTTDTLRARLSYEPAELHFGTSGRRGKVVDLTQLEITATATAELRYFLSLPKDQGGIRPGERFFYARDLRPSSAAFDPEQGGRGEIAQAIEQAIRDAGLIPVNLGRVPTPALAAYALNQNCGSMMITGSHIPFDRNGYKANSSRGELSKTDEAPIEREVAAVRAALYETPFDQSPFDARGMFKAGHRELSPEDGAGRAAYIARYRDFFAGASLAGKTVVVYQHSAVGRDLVVEVLTGFGATVIPAGRSGSFVPIDTEAIDDATLTGVQSLADAAARESGKRIDAVVSTDGDSDRPLMLGVEPSGAVRFFGGDLLGMVVAETLGAQSVVVPISCNDAIDRGALRDKLEPKTKIGSPYVIAGMDAARAAGKTAICGWEANGGFLTGSAFVRNGHTLPALPTRDALLPLLTVLFRAAETNQSVVELFAALPHRYSKAALLRQFPRESSDKIVALLSPDTPNVRREIEAVFTAVHGFSSVARLEYTDGVRIYFDSGDVAHIRPSGNAPELRVYAVADTQARADAIAAFGVAEPDGALRQFERRIGGGISAILDLIY